MLKKVSIGILLLTSMAFSTISVAAEEPSMHQIYQAAEAGKMNEAQAMMNQVLRDHPNSAKAHFVDAELLAKQGRLVNAETELSNAERLAPGLPFAKPQAIQNLKSLIGTHHQTVFSTAVNDSPSAATAGIPWGMILIGIAALFAIFYFVRSSNRNNTSVAPAIGAGYAPSAPLPSYGTGAMAPQMGQPVGGGIGSGIMGGLATGAALGAGMVAGEALMHHFTDGDRHVFGATPPIDNTVNTTPDDMGGVDFGVTDNSSWDDNSGGGNDWDN